MVYGHGEFEEIIESESPDFHIRKRGQALTFGVEVTEFYRSESNARAHNIPEYVTQILTEERYRHKDDKTALPICVATLVRDGDPDREIRGIFQEAPEISEYTRLIAQTIRGKDEKLKGYAAELTHVNLIVFDTEDLLFKIATKDFYMYLFTPDIIAALRQSGYREVYLITRLETDRRVYIPMKLVLFLSELYVFDHTLVTHYPDLCTDTAEELRLFAQYLRRNGMGEVCIRSTETECEVVWSGYGVIIAAEKQPKIRDYADYQVPSDFRPIDFEAKPPFTESTFEEKLNAFLECHTFTCQLAYDLKSEVVPL
jgi:hypothetical protein